MTDELKPARTRRPGGRPTRPASPAPSPYQVSVYIDHLDEPFRVHTEDCRDERQARNFALNMLVAAYIELVCPCPEQFKQRMIWCALVPGRWVGGQWKPDPRAEKEVDLAWLDSDSGLITFDPAASIQRWRPLPAVRGD